MQLLVLASSGCILCLKHLAPMHPRFDDSIPIDLLLFAHQDSSRTCTWQESTFQYLLFSHERKHNGPGKVYMTESLAALLMPSAGLSADSKKWYVNCTSALSILFANAVPLPTRRLMCYCKMLNEKSCFDASVGFFISL